MTGIGKITTAVAVVFMLTSLTLAYLSSETARDSVVRDLKPITTPPALPEQMQVPEEIIEEELYLIKIYIKMLYENILMKRFVLLPKPKTING